MLQNLDLKLADSNGESITATEFIRDFVDTLDHTGASEMQQSFDQYFEAMEASMVRFTFHVFSLYIYIYFFKKNNIRGGGLDTFYFNKG